MKRKKAAPLSSREARVEFYRRQHGVEANLEFEDYLKGLKSLRRVW